MKKFISYGIVGGLATLVEWAGYLLLHRALRFPYMAATALAIVISTFSNWLFGRLLTFKGRGKRKVVREIIQIYAASIVGLLLNLLVMWLLHGKLGINDMAAKIVATGLVFFYNYFIRDLVIYKENKEKGS